MVPVTTNQMKHPCWKMSDDIPFTDSPFCLFHHLDLLKRPWFKSIYWKEENQLNARISRVKLGDHGTIVHSHVLKKPNHNNHFSLETTKHDENIFFLVLRIEHIFRLRLFKNNPNRKVNLVRIAHPNAQRLKPIVLILVAAGFLSCTMTGWWFQIYGFNMVLYGLIWIIMG